jgi:hypothetical protein
LPTTNRTPIKITNATVYRTKADKDAAKIDIGLRRREAIHQLADPQEEPSAWTSMPVFPSAITDTGVIPATNSTPGGIVRSSAPGIAARADQVNIGSTLGEPCVGATFER